MVAELRSTARHFEWLPWQYHAQTLAAVGWARVDLHAEELDPTEFLPVMQNGHPAHVVMCEADIASLD